MASQPGQIHITHAPLSARFWPVGESGRWLRALCLIAGGVAALTVSAHINVPMTPVPITMQTLVVLLIGAIYGWRLGMVTVLAYLAAGAAGLPVFAGTPERGIGVTYMMGATGGYLLGFVIAAGLVGWFAEKGFDRTVSTMFSVMVLGTVVIYIPGILWLGTVIGWNNNVLQVGLFPFVYGDALKVALGTVSIPVIWRLLPSTD